MRRYVRKVCFQTSRFKISISIWLSVQYRHWYVVHTRMRMQMDACVRRCKVLLTRIQIRMDVSCSGSNNWDNRMYFCFSLFWINYDWFILVRYVNGEKYMCLEEDECWQLQDKHYEFWCFHSNNGIFWMVNCTFHIEHDMCCFCFFWWAKWQVQDGFGCRWLGDMFNIKILFW